MKKIAIRVITYNQEKVIGRALDSLICQKEWGLYRIVVSDDCSKDRTWDILCEYKKKYPELMDIHRNELNLGIYGNVEVADSYLPECDLYGELSGDDAYCDGYFERVQKLIEEENIDTTAAIGVFSDWKTVGPDGKEEIFRQDKVLSGYSLLSLKIRGKIYSRSVLVSKCVHDKRKTLILNQGLALAEGDYDLQDHLNIGQAYYFHFVSTIYYTDIGVSAQLSVNNSDYFTTQYKHMWQYFIDHYLYNERDIQYAKYEISRADFYATPSWKSLLSMIYHNEKGLLPNCKDKLWDRIHFYLYFAKYKIKYKNN